MVGQNLPQTNKKCYSVLQCFPGATVDFKGTKNTASHARAFVLVPAAGPGVADLQCEGARELLPPHTRGLAVGS